LGFPVVVVLAGLLFDVRGSFVSATLSSLTAAIIGYAEINGLAPLSDASATGYEDVVVASALFFLTALVLRVIILRLREAIKETEDYSHAQETANTELKKLQAELEERIDERTAEISLRGSELETANRQIQRRAGQFEALAEVSNSIASIRDLQQLLPHITSVISESFGFYHVGLFLLDEVNEYAILTATNSEGGRRMLNRKHRLKVGEQGIVGTVTATNEARIALDVGKDAVFFNNPELPDTHSEMALPLQSGNRVIGALDVQSTEVEAFTEQDVQTLSLLARQVSLAIENARLFDESRKSLAESEMISRQSTREAWRRLPEQHKLLGYRYDISGATPLRETVKVEDASDGKRDRQTEAGTIVVPIELRGEVIGTLRVQSPSAKLSNEQRDLVKAVADRVALSAENARLFEETTMRAERERKVSDITSKIRSHNDPQAMIETAINELRIALQATKVEIIPQAIQGAENKKA
jgi:GAF domain-containing protein